MSVLATPAPPADAAFAEAVAREHFSLAARATPLPGERDRNFRLAHADGREAFLKLIHPAEDPAVTAVQTAALLHLAARDPSLPVPRLIRTRGGAAVAELAGGVRARLTTYLPGVPLASVAGPASTPGLPGRLGGLVGRLDAALADLPAPALRSDLLWDLANAGRLRPYLRHVADAGDRSRLERVLDGFEGRLAPGLAAMPAQPIHNDVNPSNLLVDPARPDEPTGIIDFGDLVVAPRIQDVAVAASYLVGDAGPAGEPVLAFLAGYHRANPLAGDEIDLLAGLVEVRMATTLVVSAWRAGLAPGNRDYILRNADRARRGLAAIAKADPERVRAAYRARLEEATS